MSSGKYTKSIFNNQTNYVKQYVRVLRRKPYLFLTIVILSRSFCGKTLDIRRFKLEN